MSSDPETTTDDSSPPQKPSETAADNLFQKLEKMNISSAFFSIWPPSQRTREAVIKRLIETLSTPSILSKRYGSLPHEEASATAQAIEEEAYTAATSGGGDGAATATSIDEGIEILQVYSKEISKRMLDAVKSRATDVSPVQETAGTVTIEEVSSVDNESSS